MTNNKIYDPNDLSGYYGEDKRIQEENIYQHNSRVKEERAFQKQRLEEPLFWKKLFQPQPKPPTKCDYCVEFSTYYCSVGDYELYWCKNPNCIEKCEKDYNNLSRKFSF